MVGTGEALLVVCLLPLFFLSPRIQCSACWELMDGLGWAGPDDVDVCRVEVSKPYWLVVHMS